MAIIRRSDLKNKAIEKLLNSYNSKQKIIQKSLEFTTSNEYDIFLSHSYLDATEVDVLYEDLKDMGFSVYVDWKVDHQLDRSKVTPKTAELLRKRMKACRCLLYVATDNVTNSKWCPWELGYVDGEKGKSAILPILDINEDTNSYYGIEYLGIYPYVTKGKSTAGDVTLWVQEDSETYIRLDSWLKGGKPYKH